MNIDCPAHYTERLECNVQTGQETLKQQYNIVDNNKAANKWYKDMHTESEVHTLKLPVYNKEQVYHSIRLKYTMSI